MKQGISTSAVLIAMSIVFAGATAMAAPMGLDGSQKKHETTHRHSLEQIIRHKAMGVIAMVEGGIAEAGAQQAKMKAAMAAKAAMPAKAKEETAAERPQN